MMKRIPTLACTGIALALLLNATYAAEWTQPMTSWGEPDIQGTWPINHLIGVPLQRGLNIDEGEVTYPGVAEAFGLTLAAVDKFLA